MKICVYGLWHLGSVTAACLAAAGHDVVGLDPDADVVAGLSAGHAPLFEPELDELIAKGIAQGKLRFTDSGVDAVSGAQLLWVTFDTPVDDDDIADVDFVFGQVTRILPLLEQGAVVLVSSQLPVGTVARLQVAARQLGCQDQIHFACSPENLRLGKAVHVFTQPDRVVVGVDTAEARQIVEQALLPITERIEWMSIASAEMTKHAINAFLAISVTFANEIAAICELAGADAKEVERGLKSEQRIGPKAYLAPGGPFAGGTLARDIAFLTATAGQSRLPVPLLSAVRTSNDAHKQWNCRTLLAAFPGSLNGRRIAVWGLTYKPGTDTLRRSLSVELCDWLLDQGVEVHVHDPAVKELPARWFGRVLRHGTPLDAVAPCDGLVVGTEWPEYATEAGRLPGRVTQGIVIVDANRHLRSAEPGRFARYFAVGTRVKGAEDE